VLFDGGIRSGQDIAKALAQGARGFLIGRSFLFALAAGGRAGVTKALEILRDELGVTLALTGTSRVAAAGPVHSSLNHPSAPRRYHVLVWVTSD